MNTAAQNLACTVVALSVSMPDPSVANWAVVAVGMGGVMPAGRPGLYRFPDGSALVLVAGELPVEYIGG